MSEPRVTVALMTRNRPALLRLAIESVLAQCGVQLDLIVLDNASTDETPHVVREFAARDPRITCHRNETDLGIVRNWNRGIALACARSPLVCIFHDDDVMLDGFLAESARELDAHPSAGMSLCLAQYIRSDGSPKELQEFGVVKAGLNAGLDFLELVIEGRGMDIPPPIVMFRGDALRRAGFADSPHTRGTMDMNLYYRVAAISDVVLIPQALVQYRMHEGSDTELLNRTAGGTFWYGTAAERVDVVAALLRSDRASDPAYRAWLAERLLALHAHQSTAIHPSVPQMYHTWENRRAILLDQLSAELPPSEPFILIDDCQLGIGPEFESRKVIPFLERGGEYFGAPHRAQEAIDNLEQLRARGVRWLVIAWTSFWWLDQYGAFDKHLRTNYRAAINSPHGRAYELPA